MTKATTRRLFWGGTVLFTAVFIGLTIHTHTTIAKRTHADALTPEVVRGLGVWERYNCENCHTLMGDAPTTLPISPRSSGSADGPTSSSSWPTRRPSTPPSATVGSCRRWGSPRRRSAT